VGVLCLRKLFSGYNRILLEDACRLLHDEASGTSGFVEQQHGSISAVHLKHPDLSTQMCGLRSYVHMCRTLYQPAPELKQEKRLSDRIDRLTRRLKHGVMGRNVFFKELLATTQEANPNRCMLQSPVMAQHGRLYNDLAPSAKRKYEAVASEQTRVRRKELQADLEHAHCTMALFKERQSKERRDIGITNATSEVRFNEDDFGAMEASIAGGYYTPARVEDALQTAFESPPLLSTLEADTFSAASTPAEPGENEASAPQWVKVVARNRNSFGSVVLASTNLSEVGKAYKLLYALQSPMLATFIPLRICEREIDQDLEDGEQPRARFRFEFTYKLAEYISEALVPFDADGGDIVVLQAATFIGDHKIVSDFPPLAWDAFVAGLWE
jgi:hypothetical protein